MMPYFMDNANPPVRKMGPRLAFEDDHHILAEEQKACRARARKFSHENTRRRKAQEERRKAEEIREQKLQEEILQQRRQKLQEATEQHQRAHLPPSERNRPVTRRPAHLQGNVLSRIEGTFSLCDPQSPFYSGSPSTYRRCHSSNSSVPSSKPGQQRQLSAAVAYVKLLQEKSANNLQNRDLFFHKLREKQHPLEEIRANSKQENPDVGQPDQTESLFSLETENSHYSPSCSAGLSHTAGPSHSTGHTHTTDPSHTIDHSHTIDPSHASGPSHMPSPSQTAAVICASSSWLHCFQLLSTCQSHGPQEHYKGLRSASVAARESVGLHLWERQNEASLSSLPAHSQRTEEPVAPGEHGPKGPPARGGQGGEKHESRPRTEPTPASTPPSILSDQNTPTQRGTAAISDHQTYKCKPDRQSGLSDKVPLAVLCGAWAGPDATPTECSSLMGGEKTAKSIQQMGNQTDRCHITSPTRENSSGKGSGHGSKTPAASLSTVNQNILGPEGTFTASTEPWQTNRISSLPIDVNTSTTLNKDKERECPENSDPSNQIKKGDHTEEVISNSSVSAVGETHKHTSTDLACNPVSSTSDIKLIKGILKKQSKYVSGVSVPSQTSGSFNFTKQRALSIRDSVELTKHDSKEPESIKKKLRWLDEERLDVAKGGPGAMKGFSRRKDTPPHLQRKSAQLQKHPLCAGRPTVVQVAAGIASTGYQFAKQAWSDGGGREGPLQDHGRGKGSPRGGGPNTPRAPGSAGSAPAGPRSVYCRSRKGTGVRPQSATGSSSVDQGGGRTQGRIILPRPPCRTGKSEGDVEGSSPSNKAPDSCATPERRTAMTVSSLTFTTFPPTSTVPSSALQNVTKGICIYNQRYSLGNTDGESNPCPNSASTGQEVYQLWNGIQSTLEHKGSNSSFHSWVST
ncbi:hypothetical protein SKAU_G00086620 [Synaphobranchus kaupii]|uniref:Uncharacterized protein n=1 Tax=Synaphobranchus kaupii TaxID=118154 RepID=A0A9Q1FVJ4_SYNKA|nr:hypothetical protein SKAU_G00086620 [Synaphobranchus kaupii]